MLTLLILVEGNTGRADIARHGRTLRGQRPHARMDSTRTGTGRVIHVRATATPARLRGKVPMRRPAPSSWPRQHWRMQTFSCSKSYDHRLRDLTCAEGDPTLFHHSTTPVVPRSTVPRRTVILPERSGIRGSTAGSGAGDVLELS